MPIRVMLVDTRPERRELLAPGLEAEGFDVIAALAPEDDLLDAVARFAPDVVLIDMESPSRDALEGLRRVQNHQPRPMVLFSQDDASESIRRAVDAGVNAYIVDGIAACRVRPIVDAAMAQFKQFRALEQELEQTRTRLAERKLIERAKGLVMQQQGVGEADAFQAMRRLAMRKNKRLADIAEGVIAAAELMQP
jgi:response regulator NasT